MTVLLGEVKEQFYLNFTDTLGLMITNKNLCGKYTYVL